MSARCHGQLTGLVLLQLEQPVEGLGRVVLAGIVHEVEDHQALLALVQPHPPAQLLGVEHLGHGRPGHEQHLDFWAVPALVKQVAGAQHLDIPVDELILELFSLRLFRSAGHGGCPDTCLPEQLRNLLGVFYRSAEHHSAFILDVLEPSVHD